MKKNEYELRCHLDAIDYIDALMELVEHDPWMPDEREQYLEYLRKAREVLEKIVERLR